jgi:hypothetical protein
MVLTLLGSIGLICSGCWLWFDRSREIGIFFATVGALYTIIGAFKIVAHGAA